VIRGKAITMIGIAVLFGGASLVAADFWLKNQASAQSQPQPVAAAEPAVAFETIVVAQQPLRFGMSLDRDTLSEIPWPQASLPEGAFATVDEVLAAGERVVLSPIEANEPILLTKLSGPDGRAALSNLLSPGMQAVTIQTDEVAGVGGFVTPGDRVDILLTRDMGQRSEVEGAISGMPGGTVTAQVVVTGAKVLSVGQGADVRSTGPQIVASVTVEVNGEDARKLALARSIGSLSLSLRSVGAELTPSEGLTTISSFGTLASVKPGEASEEGGTFLGGLFEPKGPKYSTVVVTRGLETETYRVVSPEQ
jgi:pilus assembly protein CpaB